MFQNSYLKLISSDLFNIVRRYHDGHFKPPTMDELPVPRGSWQAQYDANQRRYNTALLLGIAFTTGTLFVVRLNSFSYCILLT